MVATASPDWLWPGKIGGHCKPALEPRRAFIVERIAQNPHVTLHGLKAELLPRGMKASHNAVWIFSNLWRKRWKLSRAPLPTWEG